MKKVLVMALAGLMILSAGCTGKAAELLPDVSGQPEIVEQEPSRSGEKNEAKPDDKSDAPQDKAEDAEMGEAEEMGEMLFGKVKSIVGNEIELELAEPPFDMSMDSGDEDIGGSTAATPAAKTITINNESEVSEGDTFSAAEGDAGGGDGLAAADEVSIFVAGEDGQVMQIGGANGEGMELEYTGETKSIIIPAGAEIINFLGTEATMDSIKKGSVLMVTMDIEDEESASSIFIME